MKFLFLFIAFLLLSGCETAPKGEYSRSKIERPYSTPDDIARSTFGVRQSHFSAKNLDKTLDLDDETVNQTSPTLNFEWGLSDNVSWLFPIGLKYGLYQSERHTFGLTAQTAFLATNFSIDYWYRASSRFSIRPFYRGAYLNILFYREERLFQGLDFIYQINKPLALTVGGYLGHIKQSSDFLDAIINSYTESESSHTETEGSFWGAQIGVLYSISDRWDTEMTVFYENHNLEDLRVDALSGKLSFSYIW